MRLVLPILCLVFTLIVAGGCPTPPPVTITLPGAVPCTGTVTTNVTAAIHPDVNMRPQLTVTVCVLCNGAPLVGVTGITAAFISEVPIPATVPATATFGATGATGCTSLFYIVPGSVLRGQQVTVTVVDTTGAVVSTSTVTIQ